MPLIQVNKRPQFLRNMGFPNFPLIFATFFLFLQQTPYLGVAARWFPSPPMRNSNRALRFVSTGRKAWWVSAFTWRWKSSLQSMGKSWSLCLVYSKAAWCDVWCCCLCFRARAWFGSGLTSCRMRSSTQTMLSSLSQLMVWRVLFISGGIQR